MRHYQTGHQARIEQFMQKAGQDIPPKPTVPSEEVRILRAKLIFEEAVRELIAEGLAVEIVARGHDGESVNINSAKTAVFFHISSVNKPDLVKIADGCADTSVVTTGTLSACGIADAPILKAVDESNLQKFVSPDCPTCCATLTWVESAREWRCENDRCPADNFPKEAGPYRREDGKWVKPPYWQAPDIAGLLQAQEKWGDDREMIIELDKEKKSPAGEEIDKAYKAWLANYPGFLDIPGGGSSRATPYVSFVAGWNARKAALTVKAEGFDEWLKAYTGTNDPNTMRFSAHELELAFRAGSRGGLATGGVVSEHDRIAGLKKAVREFSTSKTRMEKERQAARAPNLGKGAAEDRNPDETITPQDTSDMEAMMVVLEDYDPRRKNPREAKSDQAVPPTCTFKSHDKYTNHDRTMIWVHRGKGGGWWECECGYALEVPPGPQPADAIHEKVAAAPAAIDGYSKAAEKLQERVQMEPGRYYPQERVALKPGRYYPVQQVTLLPDIHVFACPQVREHYPIVAIAPCGELTWAAWEKDFGGIAKDRWFATDEETVKGWFANAIMRGYDERARLAIRDEKTHTRELNALMKAHDNKVAALELKLAGAEAYKTRQDATIDEWRPIVEKAKAYPADQIESKARADQDNKWLALLDCYYRNEVALGWLGRRPRPRQAFLNDLAQCKVEEGNWVCNLPGMAGKCTAEKNDAETQAYYTEQAKAAEAAKAEYERRKAEIRAGLLLRKPGESFSAYHLCDEDESYWSLGKAVQVYLELAAEGLCTQQGEREYFKTRKPVSAHIQPVTIPVAHTAADFINNSAQSHRGWWATIDTPEGCKEGDLVAFRDTMNGLILDTGVITGLVPPGIPCKQTYGSPWPRFDTWWRIVYDSAGLKEKVTVTARPTGGGEE